MCYLFNSANVIIIVGDFSQYIICRGKNSEEYWNEVMPFYMDSDLIATYTVFP